MLYFHSNNQFNLNIFKNLLKIKMTKANNILKILIVYFIIQPNEGTILNLNNLSNLLSDTSCSTTNTTNIKMTACKLKKILLNFLN